MSTDNLKIKVEDIEEFKEKYRLTLDLEKGLKNRKLAEMADINSPFSNKEKTIAKGILKMCKKYDM